MSGMPLLLVGTYVHTHRLLLLVGDLTRTRGVILSLVYRVEVSPAAYNKRPVTVKCGKEGSKLSLNSALEDSVFIQSAGCEAKKGEWVVQPAEGASQRQR